MNLNGFCWRDAPKEYGSHKTDYSRCKRWSDEGIFARIMAGLATAHGEQKTVMIDVSRRTPWVRVSLRKYLRAHRTATSMAVKKGGRGRLIGRTKGGMNTRLHAICDSQRRPIDLFVTAGQVSDCIGARALLSGLSNVKSLLGDRGYDADWFREALQDKGIRTYITGRKKRKEPVKYDKRRHKRRNRIEIMFGRFKD